MYLKNLAIERIARQLENLGCKFKIITPDGAEFGDMVATKPKLKRVPVRKLSNCDKILEDIGPGETRLVPVGDLLIDRVQSTACSYMTKTFGAGTYLTSRLADNSAVEVLRLE